MFLVQSLYFFESNTRSATILGIVGAGAVVSKDVEPYTIVAGVPAKPIRRRFTPTEAEALLDLAWWDWPHGKLKGALEDFRTLGLAAFIEKFS